MTVDTARPLPANFDAERALLGAAILNPNSALEVVSLVREVDFFQQENRLIFRRIQSLLARGVAVDLVTLTDDLHKCGELEKSGGAGYLASLSDGMPRITNVRHYAKIVRDEATRRRLIDHGQKLQELAWGGESLDGIINCAVTGALDMATGQDSAVVARSWPEVASSAVREIELAHANPSSMRRFQFGLKDLDEMIGGLRPKELAVIVAPTSSGKTLLASQGAIKADRDGFKAIYFSAEMPAEQIVLRELAFQAEVKFYFARRPEKLDVDELQRLRAASERKCNINFVDRDITPTRVWAMSEVAKKTCGLDLIFIDYDQLVIEAGIDPNGDDDSIFRHQRAFVLAAKRLAERLDICVLLLCQLRKVSPQVLKGAQPHLDDIWGDSSIRNTPHLILWLSREFFTHNMDKAYERKANVYVLKSRNDRTGIVPLEFDPEGLRFLDVPRAEEDFSADCKPVRK